MGVTAVPRWLSCGVGLTGGTIGALLGGGTGVVSVPVLDRFTQLSRKTIHGTVALPNVTVAAVGAVIYELRGGHIDFALGGGLMLGAVIGAFGGARFAARASERFLRVAFFTVLTAAGTQLCLSAAGIGPTSGSPLLDPGLREGAVAIASLTTSTGLVVGAWSAAMGIGGGSLTVPALILLFGVGPHTAEGTSLLVMLPSSLAASLQHLRQGTASLRLGVALGCGATPGAFLGATIGLVLSGVLLDWVFGLFLFVVASQQLRQILLTRRAQRASR